MEKSNTINGLRKVSVELAKTERSDRTELNLDLAGGRDGAGRQTAGARSACAAKHWFSFAAAVVRLGSTATDSKRDKAARHCNETSFTVMTESAFHLWTTCRSAPPDPWKLTHHEQRYQIGKNDQAPLRQHRDAGGCAAIGHARATGVGDKACHRVAVTGTVVGDAEADLVATKLRSVLVVVCSCWQVLRIGDGEVKRVASAAVVGREVKHAIGQSDASRRCCRSGELRSGVIAARIAAGECGSSLLPGPVGEGLVEFLTRESVDRVSATFVPPGVVTSTLAVPAGPVGVVQITDVAVFALKAVQPPIGTCWQPLRQ